MSEPTEPLVVASNRGPLSFREAEDGSLLRSGPGGGLAGTLQPLLAGTGSTWVSVSMSDADRRAVEAGLMTGEGLSLVTVLPEPAVYRMAYDVVSNATLWFTHHQLYDLPRRPRFDAVWFEAWEAYRALNRQVGDAVAEHAPAGAIVLVQDYHLSLVGSHLSDLRPDLRTVHFSHTPFAGPDALGVLPTAVAGELLGGMAGFGACGFHSARWERSFRSCYGDPDLAALTGTGPAPRTFTAPLGPDIDAITTEAASDECRQARRSLAEMVGGRRLITRVDRVELSKNIVRGFWAFDELLEGRPDWRGRVVMLALAYASREGLADYLAYRSEAEHVAERLNEKWGTADWTPILFDVADNRSRSMAAMCDYDVLLVNPVRDGLNLVAKEGPLVNANDGVVVLSRDAGAWPELEGAVLGINPFDLVETAGAMARALDMGAGERRSRAEALGERVRSRPASLWLGDQIAAAPAPEGVGR